MSVSVLLVGAGLTNSLIAKNIRSCTKLSKLLDVYVWEKTGQIGGRFQTTTAAGVQNVPPTDFAAQYVTFTKGQGQEWAEPYFTELVKADMIKKITLPPHPGYPQDYKKDNYAFTQGAAAVVKYFFNQGGLNETNIKLNHNLLGIKMRDNYKIDVSYEERTKDGKTRHTGCFDAVISTIPIPAFLESEIIHSASDLNYPNGTHSKLSNIQYKSRYAVGLYFDRRIEVAPGEQKYNFVRKSGNPICYWTLEEDKTTGNSFIVVHTTVSFGKEYMNHPMAKV
jgi:predicted NAD/FAD-dependent oxidoreductase